MSCYHKLSYSHFSIGQGEAEKSFTVTKKEFKKLDDAIKKNGDDVVIFAKDLGSSGGSS